MTDTETKKIDLVEIGDHVRRASLAEEPFDAADQWAMLGLDDLELLDEIRRVRRAIFRVADDLEKYAHDRRPEKLPLSERKLAEVLRELAVDAPRDLTELAEESPHGH